MTIDIGKYILTKLHKSYVDMIKDVTTSASDAHLPI